MRLPQIEWKPISPIAFFSWLGFYVVLLIYLAAHSSELTLLDNVHLPVHEAGHLLFGWFGATLGLWGGTILQLLVPAAWPLLSWCAANCRAQPFALLVSFT